MTDDWQNPYHYFLARADKVCQRARQLSNGPHPGKMARIVEMLEERNVIDDILLRVRCLATAFDRMRELYLIYRDVHAQLDQTTAESDAREHEQTVMQKCHDEAMMLTSFVYYETSSLVNILNDCLQVSPGSNLEYLVAVRNKLLVHPLETSRTKDSDSVLSHGPILHAHLVGATSWVPSVRRHYEQQLLTCFRRSIDENDAKEANIRAILSSKDHEHLSDEDLLLLKAYNIPEPDLLQSANELAAKLSKGFLKRLRKACERSV